MLKLIALTTVILAGVSSAAHAGGGKVSTDAQNRNPPSKMEQDQQQGGPHYWHRPQCHTYVNDVGQFIATCASL